ncbi:MAG: hypothetical protein ABI353_18145 [Isosphaeraceae bacterium]
MTDLDNPYRPPDAPPTDPVAEPSVFRVRLIPATLFGLSGIMVLVGLLLQGGIMVWYVGRHAPGPMPRSLVPSIANLLRLLLMAPAGGFSLLASSAWINGRWPRAVGMSITSCLLMALTAMIAPE